MKLKIKILISIIILLMLNLILWNKCVNATITCDKDKICVGDTVKLTFTPTGEAKIQKEKPKDGKSNTLINVPKSWSANPTSKVDINYDGNVATIVAKKSGEVEIKFEYIIYGFQYRYYEISTSETYKINIQSKEEKVKELEKQIEELDLSDKYKVVPSNTADAETIKKFIISDQNYNDSKALKNVAKTNIQKIKDWKKTIDDKISTDKNHYAQPKQYGSIRDVLNDIITANNNGKSTDDAVDDDNDAIQATYELTNQSNERVINSIRTQISSLTGETRNVYQFQDVLSDTNYFTEFNDIGSSDADKIEKTISKVLSVITNIGVLVSIIIPAVVGVKYMICSVEEKAEYKKDMIPYLVGAFLLFGISIVIKILQSFGEQINNI